MSISVKKANLSSVQAKGTKTDIFLSWIPWFTYKAVQGQTQSQFSSYTVHINLRNLLGKAGKNASIHSSSVLRVIAGEGEGKL